MTTAALRRLADPSPSSGSWGWLGSVIQWVWAAVRSPGQQALLDLVEQAARQLGEPALDASDARDLDDRIDAATEHPDLFRFNAAMARLLTFDALARAFESDPKQPPRGLVDALGAGSARTVLQAHELEVATAAALAQVIVLVGPRAIESEAGALEAQGVRYLYDARVPSVVQRANFEALRGGVASLALARAIFTSRKLPPWLAQRLAETYENGLHEYARLLASIPGVVVPERVVPSNERLDLHRLAADHAAALRSMDDLVDRAVAEGGALTLSDSDSVDDA